MIRSLLPTVLSLFALAACRPAPPAGVPSAVPAGDEDALGAPALVLAATLDVIAPVDDDPPSAALGDATLDDLRALSPTLRFGKLMIDGALTLDPDDGDVALHVEYLEITKTGSIRVASSTCSNADAPDLTIVADGVVHIEGAIDLSGRDGDVVGGLCGACEGAHGGDLIVDAHEIYANGMLDTSGGAGGTMHDPDTGARAGCKGGDAGRIVLAADEYLDLDAALLATQGGRGGEGDEKSLDGVDGASGDVEWNAPRIDVADVDPNGTLEDAQPFSFVPSRLKGSLSDDDDATNATSADARWVQRAGGAADRVEDLFAMSFPGTSTESLRIHLASVATGADVDLYVFDAYGETIVHESAGASTEESITLTLAPGARFYVGVSLAPGAPVTAYALDIEAAAQ